jgi:pimeloyl-ACP methyl ester carboxylesterase
VTLAYERRGSGPPLVLIHGLGGSTVIWRPVIERLAAERDVIALDLPGFGRSPAASNGRPPSAANLAAAVGSFCAEIGVERPHVAGNSLGGWVALELGRIGAARSVCGLAPAGLWKGPLRPVRRDAQWAGRRLRPVVATLLRSRAGRRALLRSTVAHPDRVPAADAREMVWLYIDAPAYTAANAAMRAGAFDGGGEVDAPVTIAWGTADRLLQRPRPERMPPGARYLEVPGWGHTPTWDDPPGVAALLLAASAG